jgi:3-deoxy-D-manno-octulosonate 8-phosphate phosphatase (KDO 8-P phosphatase)
MSQPASRLCESSVADWAKIQALVLDVDGVLTDGTIFVGPDGFELKQFSILDGMGLACLKKLGVTLAVISGRMSPATTSRMTELNFDHVIQGREDKGVALTALASEIQIPVGSICYMGDDEIDIPALKASGIGVAVANAVSKAIAAADYVTENPGGQGAVREVCDRILESRNESVLSLSTQ